MNSHNIVEVRAFTETGWYTPFRTNTLKQPPFSNNNLWPIIHSLQKIPSPTNEYFPGINPFPRGSLIESQAQALSISARVNCFSNLASLYRYRCTQSNYLCVFIQSMYHRVAQWIGAGSVARAIQHSWFSTLAPSEAEASKPKSNHRLNTGKREQGQMRLDEVE